MNNEVGTCAEILPESSLVCRFDPVDFDSSTPNHRILSLPTYAGPTSLSPSSSQ